MTLPRNNPSQMACRGYEKCHIVDRMLPWICYFPTQTGPSPLGTRTEHHQSEARYPAASLFLVMLLVVDGAMQIGPYDP